MPTGRTLIKRITIKNARVVAADGAQRTGVLWPVRRVLQALSSSARRCERRVAQTRLIVTQAHPSAPWPRGCHIILELLARRLRRLQAATLWALGAAPRLGSGLERLEVAYAAIEARLSLLVRVARGEHVEDLEQDGLAAPPLVAHPMRGLVVGVPSCTNRPMCSLLSIRTEACH